MTFASCKSAAVTDDADAVIDVRIEQYEATILVIPLNEELYDDLDPATLAYFQKYPSIYN